MRGPDVDPKMGDFEAQGVGELFDPCLGGVIRRKPRRRGEGRRGGDDQDVAAPVDDGGQCGADGVEDANDVDIDESSEGLWIDLEYRAVRRDPGIGHHDVDAAEPVHGAGCHVLHCREVTDVGDGREHPVLAQVGADLAQCGLIDIGEHQVGASGVQPARHFRADPAGAAGDQDDLLLHRTH